MTYRSLVVMCHKVKQGTNNIRKPAITAIHSYAAIFNSMVSSLPVKDLIIPNLFYFQKVQFCRIFFFMYRNRPLCFKFAITTEHKINMK